VKHIRRQATGLTKTFVKDTCNKRQLSKIVNELLKFSNSKTKELTKRRPKNLNIRFIKGCIQMWNKHIKSCFMLYGEMQIKTVIKFYNLLIPRT
jgi:hypothetical protein